MDNVKMGVQCSDEVIDLATSPPENDFIARNGVHGIGALGDISSALQSDGISVDEPVPELQAGAGFELNPTFDSNMTDEEMPAATAGTPNSQKWAAHAGLAMDDDAEGETTPSEKSEQPHGGSTPTGEAIDALMGILDENTPNEDQVEVDIAQLACAAASADALALSSELNQADSSELLRETHTIDILTHSFVPGLLHPGVKIANSADAPTGFDAYSATLDRIDFLLFRSLENTSHQFTDLDELIKAHPSYSLDNIYVSRGAAQHRAPLSELLTEFEDLEPISCDVGSGKQKVKILWFDDEYNLSIYYGAVKRQGTPYGRELKIEVDDDGRLPYEYEDKPFGYIMSEYTMDKFFKLPIIIFLQHSINSSAGNEDYCRKMGWEEIKFKVHKSALYQYGNLSKDFDFFCTFRAGVNLEEDNILPDGKKRKITPSKRMNMDWSTPGRRTPNYVQDIEGVLCELEGWTSSKYDTTLGSTSVRPDWKLTAMTTETPGMFIWVECDDSSHKNKLATEELNKLYAQCAAHKNDTQSQNAYGTVRVMPYGGPFKNPTYPNRDVLKDDMKKALAYLESKKDEATISEDGTSIQLPIVYLYYDQYEVDGKYKGTDGWHRLEGFSRPDCYHMLSGYERTSGGF